VSVFGSQGNHQTAEKHFYMMRVVRAKLGVVLVPVAVL